MNDIKKIINQIVFKHRTKNNNITYRGLYTTNNEGVVFFKNRMHAFNYRKYDANNKKTYDIYHFRYFLFIQTPKNY